MRVLLVGRGGREHALAWKIKESPLLTALYVWPTGPVTGALGIPLPLASSADLQTVAKAAQELGIDLVIAGPEVPLAEGLADFCQDVGIPTFGPVQRAARLEADKAFAKDMMRKASVPTARSQVAFSEDECRQMARDLLQETGGAVLKASGLAAGKGVFVCTTREQMEAGLKHLYHTDMRRAASQVVVEEILFGRECSYFTFISTDREPSSTSLGFAVDFKRLEDGDQGPNTGGMGCYAPVPWLPDDAADQVETQVVQPLLKALRAEGIPYQGCLYVGLMWSPERGPQVIEFNVRLGDPEAQVLATLDDRDWLALMADRCGLRVPPVQLAQAHRPMTTEECAVAVVMAGETYPFGEGVESPAVLPLGLFHVKSFDRGAAAGVRPASLVFGAGIEAVSEDAVRTGAGRVLVVAARAGSFAEAREKAYRQAEDVQKLWPKARFRRDIAQSVVLE